MKYTCPVCAFEGLDEPPTDFTICPSCGTEFDYHDLIRGHDELRTQWIATGPRWHSSVIPPPPNWNGIDQLRMAGMLSYENRGGHTFTEIGLIELGEGSTIVDLPSGSVRFHSIEYGVGAIVHLLGFRLLGART